MAFGKGIVLLLVLGACSSGTPTATTGSVTSDAADSIVVSNHGGSLEGHTPRGFAGMGTGLFAGDDLNPSFPEGEGVQLFLTFELPRPLPGATLAVLASDALVVRGTPFEDLGVLSAEIVSYDAFGPAVFDTPRLSDIVGCSRSSDTRLECEVTAILSPLLDNGTALIQFRLSFDQAADGDGRQDLAMFFRTDSNTNEPGLFTLTINP